MGGLRRLGRLLGNCLRGSGSFEGGGMNPFFLDIFAQVNLIEVRILLQNQGTDYKESYLYSCPILISVHSP